MTTIRFIYNNLWREGEILAQSTELAQFPADNTQDDCKELAWRSKYGALSSWGLFRITATNNVIYFGEEEVTDPNLENWGSATDLTSWTETLAGTTTINREATSKHTGSYSARFDVDAVDSSATIYQAIAMTPSSNYRVDLWYRADAGKTAQLIIRDSGNNVFLQSNGSWAGAGQIILPTTNGVWTLFSLAFVANALYTNYVVAVGNWLAASSSVYFDDISVHSILSTSVVIGDYDTTTFCAAIKNAMDGIGSKIYTVTYSDTTNLFTIASASQFTLELSQIPNAIWATIGWTSIVNTIPWITHQAQYIRIHTEEYSCCDFGSALEYNFIALLGHNLTTNAVVTIYGADDDAFTTGIVSDVLTYNGNNIYEFLAAVRTKRYCLVMINDPANPSGYIKIGVIVVGKYFAPNRNFGKYSEGEVDETEMEKSPSMNLFTVQERPKVVAWELPFTGLDAASIATVKSMRANNGVSKALIFCTDSTAPNSNSYWAHFPELSPTDFETLAYGVWTASLEEVL